MKKNINHVLVIGGAGFIGSHVVDKLLQQGAKVTVFDRSREIFRLPLEEVNYIYGEFGNRGLLEEILCQGIDAVIHLVSSTVPKTSNEAPIFDIQSNLVETVVLLDLCLKFKIKKLVFGSSGGTIYGKPKTVPIKESHSLNPICSYGIVKLAIENYLYMYKELYGLRYVSARFGNPYGERQRSGAIQGLIPVVIEKALLGEIIDIWGDGSIVRDFIYVGDVANFTANAALSELEGTFNVSSGEGVSVNKIVELVGKELGQKLKIKRTIARNYDVPEIVLDVSKVKKIANWKPEVNLENGIKKLTRWLKKCIAEGG